MLELVTFPPAFGLRNVSPFCLKTEMLLKDLDLEFRITEQSDPRKAPKGKLPVLVADERAIADSELIAEYLDGITQGRVYEGLTAAQKADGFALTRLAEDHLYWLMVASRWLDDEWWPNVAEGFFGFVPVLIRPLIARSARHDVRRTLQLHGLGRHTLEEQRGFAERDLASLEARVPDQGFLHGAAPNVFDFTIAGLMAGIYDNRPPTWLTTLAEGHPRLKGYTERVQDRIGVHGRL